MVRRHSFARCARSLRSAELEAAACGRTEAISMVGPAEPDPTMDEGGSRSAHLELPPKDDRRGMTLAFWIAQADTATGGDALERFVYTLAQGLAQGSIYALVALGFVLVFKATRAVNFAQGAIALVTAWFFSLVLIDWAIPGRWIDANRYVEWFLSLAIAIVLAVILGLVIERLIIRPMIGEPLFAIAVITLGLEALLAHDRHRCRDDQHAQPADPVGGRAVQDRRGDDLLVVDRHVHRHRPVVRRRVPLLPHAHRHRHARRGLRPGSGPRPGHSRRQGVRHRLGREQRPGAARRRLRVDVADRRRHGDDRDLRAGAALACQP